MSRTLEEAENWGKFFAEIGRPTYHIVKLDVDGNCFVGDATKCFRGQLSKEENLKLAEIYWESCGDAPDGIREILVSGRITVTDTTSGKTFTALCNLTQRQQAILLAGGLLNYTKEGGQ